ncbi:MAG: hypothetical protein ABH816_01940 [Candidatus Levyibacteriota bacterium]
MLFEQISKKDILQIVKESLTEVKKEILATMLLEEELKFPLPFSYFSLLRKKVERGIVLKRLGFGNREDYDKIKKKIKISSKNYIFKYIINSSKYQRMIVIDRKKLFFGNDDIFFQSEFKPLVKVFSDYFHELFKEGMI